MHDWCIYVRCKNRNRAELIFLKSSWTSLGLGLLPSYPRKKVNGLILVKQFTSKASLSLGKGMRECRGEERASGIELDLELHFPQQRVEETSVKKGLQIHTTW